MRSTLVPFTWKRTTELAATSELQALPSQKAHSESERIDKCKSSADGSADLHGQEELQCFLPLLLPAEGLYELCIQV